MIKHKNNLIILTNNIASQKYAPTYHHIPQSMASCPSRIDPQFGQSSGPNCILQLKHK